MADVVRIAVRAALDHDPEREIETWRHDLERGAIDDPEETRARLRALERGEYSIAELHLSAELMQGSNGLTRRGDAVVSGCWFSRALGDENIRHARELVKEHLEDLRQDLAVRGLDVDIEELASLPIRVRLEDSLAMPLD